MLIIKGRLFTALSDRAIENGLIAMDGEDITYAGPEAGFAVPEGAAEINVGGGTILPGFTDCHAHLTGGEDAGEFADGKLFGDQIIGAAFQAGLILDAGFTGLRDMSEAGLFIARGTARGAIRGPRIVPGGKVLSITSGHVDLDPSMSKAELAAHDHLGLLVDGPDDCVKGVRDQFRLGAKFIKICATGGISSPTDRVDDVQFSDEELRAIVGETQRHHTYVCAHCTGNEGAYRALLAGVTCIEHGVMLTQREIDLMAEMDATLVSTLSVSLGVAAMTGFPDWMHRKAVMCAESNINTIAMARKAGIRIALGTDYSNSKNTPYLQLGKEFTAMVRAGMTAPEAIRAGTINAAHLMMTDGKTGVLKAGSLADIAVADGDPLTDIACLADAAHIRLVIKGGKVMKNTLGTAS
jgi:imidazolonepropionase-like amidohydrolase